MDSYQKDLDFPRVWSEFRLVIEMMSPSEIFLRNLNDPIFLKYSTSSVNGNGLDGYGQHQGTRMETSKILMKVNLTEHPGEHPG